MPPKSESWSSKILLAIFSAALGVAGSVVVFRITAKEPHLTVTITAPTAGFGENKVTQFLTIKNDGRDLAKSVRLSLKSMQGRMYEDEFRATFNPVRLDPAPTPRCDSGGDCVLLIGDLQPQAYLTVRLRYKRPVLTESEIDTFSDNAPAEKIKTKMASQDLIQP